jgi:hypothetical protein
LQRLTRADENFRPAGTLPPNTSLGPAPFKVTSLFKYLIAVSWGMLIESHNPDFQVDLQLFFVQSRFVREAPSCSHQ